MTTETGPVTAGDILKLTSENAAAGVASWLGTKAFTALVGGHDIEDVERDLKQVLENQEKILESLQDVMMEVEWESLATQAKEAMGTIHYCSQRLHEIMSITSKSGRKKEARSLMDRVLSDREDGMRQALMSLDDLLMGNGPFVKKGFLRLFVHRLDEEVRRWSSGLTTRTYEKRYSAFVNAVFHYQLVGLTVLVSAYLGENRSGDKSDALIQIKTQAERLAGQTNLLTSIVSGGWDLFAKGHKSFLFKNPHGYFMGVPREREVVAVEYQKKPSHNFLCKLSVQKSGEYYLTIGDHIIFGGDLGTYGKDGGLNINNLWHYKTLVVRPIPSVYPGGNNLGCALLTPTGYIGPVNEPNGLMAVIQPKFFAWIIEPHKD